MLSPRVRTALAMLSMIFVLVACGLPTANSEETTQDSPAAESAPGDPASPAEAPTEAAAESVPPTEIAAEPTALQHKDKPVSLPAAQSGEAADFNSSKVLESKGLIGGDRFTFGRFERPFNAEAMDTYFPELDIVFTKVFQDEVWIYGQLQLQQLNENSSSPAQYALELDTNLNGKAEWLVVVAKPTSTEWSVAGVRVYQDANSNVGGEMPTLTDNTPVTGDGFETLFFDQGAGNSADTAFVRISPNDPNTIEFALNRADLANPSKYLINFWAGNNIDPAKFDLNDAFTHEQAGAADSGLTNFYPIKAIAEIDNSCRMAVGFQPTGEEPGLCDTLKPEKPGDPATTTSCNATPTRILACILSADPGYSCSFNSKSCSCECEYTGPN